MVACTRSAVGAMLTVLIVRDWLERFRRIENQVESSFRERVKPGLEAMERRARDRYRTLLSEGPLEDGRVSGSASRARLVERELAGIYGPPLAEDGQLVRGARAGMRRLVPASVSEVRDHLQSAELVARSVGDQVLAGAIAESEALARAEQELSGLSAWALRRDAEQLARRAAHRSALSFSSADDELLSSALGSAGRITRLSRSSVRNTFTGVPRQVVRSTVHTAASRSGAFDRWALVSPFSSSRPAVSVSSEAAWIRAAKRSSRGSWRPGNPVKGFGLHVGSRSFFAPVLAGATLAALADALCAAAPAWLASGSIDVTAASFDGRSGAPLEIGGRRVRTLEQFAQAASGFFAGEARRGPRSLSAAREAASSSGSVAGEVLLVIEEERVLVTLDRGVQDGLLRDALVRVRSPRGAARGLFFVVASYQRTALAVEVFDAGSRVRSRPRIGDVFATAAQTSARLGA